MNNISVNTSGKDFDSIIDSLIAFATIQYGPEASVTRVWSDFNLSSFSRNWAELVAYTGDQLMFYMDTQANQSYLRSATIPAFVIDIANQLGYEVPTQKSSSGKVQLQFTGPASVGQFYPVFAGNTKFITTRSVTATQAGGIEVDAIQGSIFNESFTADGIQNEEFILIETDIIVDITNPNPELRSPIVVVNGTTYNIVNTLVNSSPNSTDVIRKELPDGRTKLIFGDGIFGRRLVENETVNITYRNEGGTQGNIEAGEITTLGTAITNLSGVSNSTPFSGGVDRLTLQQIKDRVPLSLKTVAGAVSLPDFADILIANYPEVLTANAALNNVQAGIDLDIFVLPNAESVTNITDNQVLFNTLTDFIERRKVVGTQFLIKNANPVNMLISIEAFLQRDASRSAVEADIREKVAALFDLQTGGADGTGVGFQETVLVSDLFDVLRKVNGLARFEIHKHTISPRVDKQVSSVNQNFYISKVDTYDTVERNEWTVVTSEVANPEPANGQVSYKVFKRTLGNVTSLNADSITDSNLDLTVHNGSATVSGGNTLTDYNSVFKKDQYNNYLLVDSNNNIWSIAESSQNSIKVNIPALNDAAILAVTNGNYKIVESFSGNSIGVNGASFTILYNNHNTFTSTGASFDLIATLKSQFILSEEQSNTGSYGVPVSIASVSPVGANPGDLVEVDFNSNPNLQDVDTSYVLVDSRGELFEIESITGNDSTVVSYNNTSLIDSTIVLTDTGANQSTSIEFIPNSDVNSAFLEVTVSLTKVDNPLGAVYVEVRQDNAGEPGTIIQASNPADCLTLGVGSAVISFNFPSQFNLIKSEKYHLVVQTDSSYKTSYAAAGGSVSVDVDTSTLEYSPAKTAEGSIVLNSTALTVKTGATGSVTINSNFIRSSKQATLLVKLLNNDKFLIGTNTINIYGQPFTASASSGTGLFQVGVDITATRDNLFAAINAQLTGIVSVTSVGTDMFELQADVVNFKGEAGNSINVSVIDPGDQNFNIGGLSNLVGGLDGDKVIVDSPIITNTDPYIYTASSGTVEYSVPMSLPTFKQGDRFRDGSGNEFDILSIDVGLNTVTVEPGTVINTALDRELSGAIFRPFVYEFGNNVSIGVDTTATAANLAAAINPQINVIAISSTNIVNLSTNLEGSSGNTIKLSSTDAGQTNFTLSGSSLAGGVDGDVISIDNFTFTPVSTTPANSSEFEVDIVSLNNTLTNLSTAINTTVGITVNSSVNLGAKLVQVAAVSSGAAGNLITLEVTRDVSGQIKVSGPTLEGGEDNKSVKTYDGVDWLDYTPEADMIFAINILSDRITVISKSDSAGNQLLPQISLGGVFDAGLGKRYYSDNSEVSFIIASRSANSLILGGENVDIFGMGVNSGSSVRVDQFTFRTSLPEDDITNLRASEIPVLINDNLKLSLLGGVV